MHLPDAPEPAAAARRRLRAERRRLQRRLAGGEEGEGEEEEDEDGAPGADEEGDAECDDPTRRMRRSIRNFEAATGVRVRKASGWLSLVHPLSHTKLDWH
jgi:hypothetical protein